MPQAHRQGGLPQMLGQAMGQQICPLGAQQQHAQQQHAQQQHQHAQQQQQYADPCYGMTGKADAQQLNSFHSPRPEQQQAQQEHAQQHAQQQARQQQARQQQAQQQQAQQQAQQGVMLGGQNPPIFCQGNGCAMRTGAPLPSQLGAQGQLEMSGQYVLMHMGSLGGARMGARGGAGPFSMQPGMQHISPSPLQMQQMGMQGMLPISPSMKARMAHYCEQHHQQQKQQMHPSAFMLQQPMQQQQHAPSQQQPQPHYPGESSQPQQQLSPPSPTQQPQSEQQQQQQPPQPQTRSPLCQDGGVGYVSKSPSYSNELKQSEGQHACIMHQTFTTSCGRHLIRV
ncbi:hypothetical protein T492DRAFT_957305 [Pavlovales sp. CCMP2436]|nr:hypothetical protein T492DRAFT_957305 [Pavlovales sp. CCMP2436]